MPLTLQIESELPEGVLVRPIMKVFRVFAESVDDLAGRINLVFVNDEEIREINRKYAGNDYPTDVLSFSYLEDEGGPIDDVVGEIAISIETAARQAERAAMELDDELALLVLHGSLHIVGYDHQTSEERQQMDDIQRRIMNSAGIPYKEMEWKS